MEAKQLNSGEWVSTEQDHLSAETKYEMSPHEKAEIDQAIVEGQEDIRLGRTRPLNDVLSEIRQKYRIAG